MFCLFVVVVLYACEDVAEWTGEKRLKMDTDKMEFAAFGTKSKINEISPNFTHLFIPCHDRLLS